MKEATGLKRKFRECYVYSSHRLKLGRSKMLSVCGQHIFPETGVTEKLE
jgi:hypothetical protein